MLDKHVIREGTLLMKGGEVFLDGWEINEGGMCREVAILACHYAARRLLEFASRLTMEAGSAHVVMDLPPETPREWLCPETKRFIDMFDSSTTQETGTAPEPPEKTWDCVCGRSNYVTDTRCLCGFKRATANR